MGCNGAMDRVASECYSVMNAGQCTDIGCNGALDRVASECYSVMNSGQCTDMGLQWGAGQSR